MLYILIFFYSWVYQLDIYLVNVFFMFNVWMFNIEKKKKEGHQLRHLKHFQLQTLFWWIIKARKFPTTIKSF